MKNINKKYRTEIESHNIYHFYFVKLLVFILFGLYTGGCDKEVSRSPVEPDPSMGVINISSSPKGATIFLNGRNTGRQTPDSLTFLNPDTYEITLKLQYYKDTSLTVQHDEDMHTELNIDYFSNPSMYGNLILFSVPAGASIFLNDSSLNKATPDTLFGLLPGLYKVTFKLNGHRDSDINALVESSITRNFSVALRDTSVWIDFQKSNSDIQSNLLTSVAVDFNGIKWIGSSDIGLIKYDDNNFSILILLIREFHRIRLTACLFQTLMIFG